MIRDSVPSDSDEISRLCICQYKRLPWPICPEVVGTGWRVRSQGDTLSGAMCYSLSDRLYVLYLWVEDNFAGYRAAVELSRDAEKLAEKFHKPLLFGIPVDNERFMKVVMGAGYAPTHITFEKVNKNE